MSKRTLYSLFLAFALLFSQQGAAWHALSHLSGSPSHTQHEKNLPQGEQCIKCAVFSQLGAACASSVLSIDLLTFNGLPQVHAVAPYDQLRFPSYQSRAPPFSI